MTFWPGLIKERERENERESVCMYIYICIQMKGTPLHVVRLTEKPDSRSLGNRLETTSVMEPPPEPCQVAQAPPMVACWAA